MHIDVNAHTPTCPQYTRLHDLAALLEWPNAVKPAVIPAEIDFSTRSRCLSNVFRSHT